MSEQPTVEHEHRFGRTWYAESGRIVRRWCIDCESWVDVDLPVSAARDFPRERARVTPPAEGQL